MVDQATRFFVDSDNDEGQFPARVVKIAKMLEHAFERKWLSQFLKLGEEGLRFGPQSRNSEGLFKAYSESLELFVEALAPKLKEEFKKERKATGKKLKRELPELLQAPGLSVLEEGVRRLLSQLVEQVLKAADPFKVASEAWDQQEVQYKKACKEKQSKPQKKTARERREQLQRLKGFDSATGPAWMVEECRRHKQVAGADGVRGRYDLAVE
eukprot:TRINITY_DN44268_c0_g1_i1.p1 TRINITY_DN44268_c0_g1~~TRINITY_DN44268_c0_g1_i1.p1  ORF type:complete len:212 (+),score=48.15 TRINITY_DN44268_c0_g1_i1:111-746(+)